MNLQYVIQNMNQYIESEGLKRRRLAKRLGMSESNFSDYLNGKRMNGIYDFAAHLAEALGHEHTFFMEEDFHYVAEEQEEHAFLFSAGEMLSESGEEGLHQLTKLCDLIEIYSRGESHA
ncbi:helix-turn-helix domain-containing protein [Bacillus cytotoxicus]|uniref:transcriptional regulator n=1 Tax=Bacillus cereus group sp. BfR-BA-01492 TaxID=2920361 RepID=UPI001F55CCA3|nr:transcriptional regulator [Bacillus cereus group sp. BfR-BA-01492]EMA6343028.1 helix-turn-helix transcriptional regulator [Bacillus cytotoxicus]